MFKTPDGIPAGNNYKNATEQLATTQSGYNIKKNDIENTILA